MRQLFIFINLTLIAIWGVLLFLSQFNSYSYFTNQLINILNIEEGHRLAFLTLLSPKIFFQLKWLFLLLLIFQIATLIIGIKKPSIFQKAKQCIKATLEFPQWLFSSFKKLNRGEQISLVLFVVILIIHRLWLSNNTDVIYDEAWTYLAFTSKNPLVAASFYPTSNNHILFSHLTQITKFLPFSILTNLRLSALIPNILAVSTLFFCLRKYFNPIAVWCGIILFAFSFPMVYYGFVARGYSLIVLFFTVGFFSLLDILHNFENKKAWYRLLISSVLGFYTIPIYLYPFVSLFGFAMIYFLATKNQTAIIRITKYGVATCILTFIIYLPVFAVSGIQSVTSNKFVNSLTLKEVTSGFLNHLCQTLHFFTSSENIYLYALLLLGLLVWAIRIIKFKPAVYLSLFLILMIPVLIFIHKVLPVERTWIYLLIPLTFIVCLIIDKLKFSVAILGICIIYSVLMSFNWAKQMRWYDEICTEDYFQGQYFSNYFHNKKVTIITSSRMNSYLKFNKILRNENWLFTDKYSDSITTNCYYIHYIEKESHSPDDLLKIVSIDHYELYKFNNR